MKTKLENTSQTQRERLFYIDFKLRFLGLINRNDLVTRFGIKAAAATRDISLYKELAPENLTYNTRAKTYIGSHPFKPLFSYAGSQALTALCRGLGDDHVTGSGALIPSESPTQLNFPNLDMLAVVTKAIHQRKCLNIVYRSITSGKSSRKLVPFALVDNGLRWHIRAYDGKKKNFADFVVNRIETAELLDATIPVDQSREADIQWNRIVEMHIVPHPKLANPETIALEYGMQRTGNESMLTIQVRAAVAGYVLRRWNVDCSENHTLDRPEVHLWLKNRQTLYGVENLSIAPGYEAKGEKKPYLRDCHERKIHL